jgi:hypothetical protein
MEYVNLIDISSIIWNEADFHQHTPDYYVLRNSILEMIDKFEKERPKYLLRDELLQEMMANFPYHMMPVHFSDFATRVYSFLGGIAGDTVSYADYSDADYTSLPNLIKDYYNDAVKTEVEYLVTELHTNKATEQVYFTFSYLWQNNNLLQTRQLSANATYDYVTVVSDRNDELNDFFKKRRRTFDHNNKHTRIRANVGGFVARLSCYDGNNPDPAQKLLDESMQDGKNFYAYDMEYEVYVIFFKHVNNLYHAHDVDNVYDVPHKVRKRFNK